MIYDYQCPKGHIFERVMSVKDHKRRVKCDCGKMAKQVILKAPKGFVQAECRYDSPIDGRPITSWSQRKDDLKRNNCQEYDPEMKTDAKRFRDEQDRKLDKAVDETIDREIDRMPGHKREQLANELKSGLTAEIVRS